MKEGRKEGGTRSRRTDEKEGRKEGQERRVEFNVTTPEDGVLRDFGVLREAIERTGAGPRC
jgi:hypothetical protein